jgi:hypothetical protein
MADAALAKVLVFRDVTVEGVEASAVITACVVGRAVIFFAAARPVIASDTASSRSVWEKGLEVGADHGGVTAVLRKGRGESPAGFSLSLEGDALSALTLALPAPEAVEAVGV